MVMPQPPVARLSRAVITAAAAFTWSLQMLPCLPSSPGLGRSCGCLLPVRRIGLVFTQCSIHSAGHSALFTTLLHQTPGPCPQPPSSWQLAWSSSSQVWQAPTLKAKHSPQHRGAGWKYHEQRRMAPVHTMQPQALQEALQPCWCLQGYKPSLCLITQGHVHSSGTSV